MLFFVCLCENDLINAVTVVNNEQSLSLFLTSRVVVRLKVSQSPEQLLSFCHFLITLIITWFPITLA